MRMIKWLLAWSVTFGMIFLTCLGGVKLGEGFFLPLLIGAYLLVPCSFWATMWFMESRGERRKLNYAIDQICPACMYDRRGINHSASCPECHAPPP